MGALIVCFGPGDLAVTGLAVDFVNSRAWDGRRSAGPIEAGVSIAEVIFGLRGLWERYQ